MGITIRPDSWFFEVLKGKQERDIRIAAYLEEIAEEATNLANIWCKVIDSIESKGSLNSEELEIWNELIGFPKRAKRVNGQQYSRLESFYQGVSTVLGVKHKDETDFIVYKIGTILKTRNLTREKVEEELMRIKTAQFFDDKNEIIDSVSLSDSIEIMTKEAAALHAYAKEFKAKI